MYRTQSVILNRKKQSVICSYFDEWSLTSKAIYNSALFIERQLVVLCQDLRQLKYLFF